MFCVFFQILFIFINTVYGLTITPQEVVDRIITHSREIIEIESNYEMQTTNYEKSFENLDWILTADINYELDKSQTLQLLKNEEDNTLSYNLGLDKKLGSGTTFKLIYSRQSQNSIFSPLSSSLNPSNARTADRLDFSINQDLWKNFFGRKDRRLIHLGELKDEKAQLKKLEELEDLIIKALEVYWASYVAKENLQASIESRERYEKLVKSIQSKAKLGYSNPGELSIALAELEEKKQTVKQNSSDFLEKVNELFRYLQIERTQEIDFNIEKLIPSPPALSTLPIDLLRASKIAKLDYDVSDLEFKNIEDDTSPSLTLTATSTLTGVDEHPGEAFGNTISGSHPIYFVGLNFKHHLFSSAWSAQRKEKYHGKEKTKAQYQIHTDQLTNKLDQGYREVLAKNMIAESSVQSLSHRSKAAKEVERSFRQGRIDINFLIQTFNSLSDAETKKIRAVGAYHMALNRLAALRDELISDDGKIKYKDVE